MIVQIANNSIRIISTSDNLFMVWLDIQIGMVMGNPRQEASALMVTIFGVLF